MDDLVVVNDPNNTHLGYCSICKMSIWKAQDRIDNGDGKGLRHVLCVATELLNREIEKLKQKLEIANKNNTTMRETLTWVLNDVQEWCECVENDASWDSWDSSYKSFHYGGIEEARKVLDNVV